MARDSAEKRIFLPTRYGDDRVHSRSPTSPGSNAMKCGIHGMLLALTLVLVGCRGEKTESGDKDGDGVAKIDHSSPEAIAKSFKSAMAERDWANGFDCLDDESQKALVEVVWEDARFTVGTDASKKESLEELLKTHGLLKIWQANWYNHVEDKRALVGALIDWLDANVPQGWLDWKGKRGFASDKWHLRHVVIANEIKQMEFINFKTDGDSATAEMTKPILGERKAYFNKVGGNWSLALFRRNDVSIRELTRLTRESRQRSHAAKNADAQFNRQILGEWELPKDGVYRLKLEADKTGTLTYKLSGLNRAALSTSKLVIKIEWSLKDGYFDMKWLSGTPKYAFKVATASHGKRKLYRIDELTQKTLVLYELKKKKTDRWTRVP